MSAEHGTEGPLSWTKSGEAVALKGAFNEKADFAGLFGALDGARSLDLSGIELINSTGVRAWMQFVEKTEQAGKKLDLVGCSVMFMSQFHMIANFTGGFAVRSFLARFVCDDCMRWDDVLLPVEPASFDKLQESRSCTCGGQRAFDDLLDPYRSLLVGE